ncbi:MAG TPA: hypothetical protein VN927_03975 [Gemmatimonadaceae bacterium]|nr:hypothetical protein [Gemmatimonadaceae bacterium]
MVDDHNPIPGRVHIQLYSVGAELDGTFERGDRVLGVSLVRPPVSDPLGRVAASACGQAFLPVIAL